MELRLMALPSGHWYGRFTSEELEALTRLSQVISDNVHVDRVIPGVSEEVAKATNAMRRIEQAAIARV